MNVKFHSRVQDLSPTWLVAALCALAAAGFGILIPMGILGPKLLIAFAGGLGILLFVLRGNREAWGALYLIAIAGFAVGHRSLYIGQATFFVPSEIIAWILAGAILVQSILERTRSLFPLPKAILFLVGWCALSVFWTPNILGNWDDALAMVKLWILALPVFYVTLNVITRVAQVQTILRLLILAALYMSVLGIVEFGFPGIAGKFPWLFNLQLALLDTQEGFTRSYLSFWGNPIGVIIIGWGVLAAVDELFHGARGYWKAVAFAALILGLITVYIAGQRATWLSMIVGMSIMMLLSGKRAGILLLLAPVLTFLPAAFWRRFTSALPFSPDFGADTSILSRLHRYQTALSETSSNPLLGVGLRAELAHNEFLAFASHVGLPAMFAFIIFLVQLFARLSKGYRESASPLFKRCSRLFVALFATWLIDLNFHPALGVAPVAAPYWFMLALAWQLPNLAVAASMETTQPATVAVRNMRAKSPSYL
jgi:O-Antigen ligase